MRSAVPLAIALTLASAALAGCFGEDTPPPATNGTSNTGGTGAAGGTGGKTNTTTGTGGNTNTTTGGGTNTTTGGGSTTFKAYNGTDNVPGGVNAMKTVTINVKSGAKTLDVAFMAKGSFSGPLGGTAIGQFMAVLKDPAGTEAGKSDGIDKPIATAVTAPGDWTLAVSFQSAPTESVDVLWDVK